MKERLRAAHDFLAAHHVMSLALSVDGRPHCCSLMYVHDGFVLSWMSDPASRHSQIIEAAEAALACVTVAPDYDDFRAIRGLQMAGVARRAGLQDSATLLAPFARRYGLFGNHESAALQAATTKAQVYQFNPSVVTFIDNAAGFGAKTTFSSNELTSEPGFRR